MAYEPWDDPLAVTQGFHELDRHSAARGHDRRASSCDEIRIRSAQRSGHFELGRTADRARSRLRFTRSISATMRYQPRAQADLIQKAAQWLVEAENPVFVVGSEIGVEGAYEEIVGAGGKAFRSRSGDDAQPLREFPQRSSAVSRRA